MTTLKITKFPGTQSLGQRLELDIKQRRVSIEIVKMDPLELRKVEIEAEQIDQIINFLQMAKEKIKNELLEQWK